MSHAVHFRDANGAVQLEDVESLDAAIARVERLRNDEGASEVRVFKEVPIEVRTYYRVAVVEPSAADLAVVPPAPAAAPDATEPMLSEVPASPAPIEPPSGAMVMSRPPMAAPDEGAAEEAPEPAGEHRRQLFSRS